MDWGSIAEDLVDWLIWLVFNQVMACLLIGFYWAPGYQTNKLLLPELSKL
jgi:hypothetical protein